MCRIETRSLPERRVVDAWGNNGVESIKFRRDCRHGKNRAVSILDQMYKLAAALDTSFRRSTFANFLSWTNEFVYTVGKFDGTLIRRNEKG